MPGPACAFCGKNWVQGCWTAQEASTCGNLDRNAIESARTLTAAMDKVERVRAQDAADIDDHEIDDIIATEEDERRRLDARIKVRHPIDMTDAGLPHLDET